MGAVRVAIAFLLLAELLPPMLPTGKRLDPAGRAIAVGNLPLTMVIGMHSFSQFDYYSRPLAGVFAAEADLTPYEVVAPDVPMDEKNPPAAPAAKPSASLDLSKPDVIDDDLFNRILWLAIKGDTPYPAAHRATPPQLLEARP